MDLLTGALYVLIGALVGGLIALTVDAYYLGQRLQKAIAAKRQTQAMLRRAERQLANSEMRGRKLERELAMASGQADPSQEPGNGLRLELEKTQLEISTLKDNLTRVSNYADELNEERQQLRQDLAATKARADTLREYFSRLDGELRELRQRYEETCERLTTAEAARKILEKDLALARKKAEAAGRMEIELHQTQFQLKTAEARVNQLEARKAPVSPESRMGASRAAEQTTRLAADDVSTPVALPEGEVVTQPSERDRSPTPEKSRISADGNELEQIKGIGPAYARRLHEAGINNLQDLASQPPERVNEILGFKVEQHDRATAWIEQARALSGD